MPPKRRLQLEGKRFGKWLVLKHVGFYVDSQALWLCRCDCGREAKVTSSRLNTGASKQCQRCGYEQSRRTRMGSLIPLTAWSAIVKCSEWRGEEIGVTREYVTELFEKQDRKCALTGVVLSFGRQGELAPEERTASLDRIDSSKGYIPGNVQWVHKDVNKMKTDFNQEVFLGWCRKVSDYSERTVAA